MDLFTSAEPRVAVHLRTMTQVVVYNAIWYKGEMLYDCAIPQKNEKGEYDFCHSAYRENEITFEPVKNRGVRIEIEAL